MTTQSALSAPQSTQSTQTNPLPAGFQHAVGSYRYSKDSPIVVYCPSDNGCKTIAAILAEEAGGKWTHRVRGYLMSPRKLQKFNDLLASALAERGLAQPA